MRNLKVLNQEFGDNWGMYHGDAVEVLAGIPDNSIDYIIYSPPFASLFTYSNSERDQGNVKDYDEFFAGYSFVTPHLMRVLKPGRLMSVHCMLLPTTLSFHGFIGLQDFRGDLIRAHQKVGMIFHSEVTIWKDPVTAMQRTKALGLLYKQLRKDSAMSRQGVPDYLVTLRKPGVNPEPVTKDEDAFPVSQWQNYASPVWHQITPEQARNGIEAPAQALVMGQDGQVHWEDVTPEPYRNFKCEMWERVPYPVWMDINPSDTLQRESAREDKDEKHIAPLQLEVIRRGIELWTNPNDVVLSPYAGIGSEGFGALTLGRRFVGVELKQSYFTQACANLRRAEMEHQSVDLFSMAGVE